MNSISIIIPNLNGEEFLPACLQSLKAAINQAKIIAEIILVDNASSDTSPEIFTTFCQKHKIKYQLLSIKKTIPYINLSPKYCIRNTSIVEKIKQKLMFT